MDPITNELQPGARALIQAGGNIVVAGLAIWIVVKPLIEAVQKNVSIDFESFYKKSNYQEHIAFLDKFRDHFEDVVRSLPTLNNKGLSIFIDDLDRCSSDRILQVLDAIKIFVDIQGCVFILGLDSEIIQQAISTKYKDDILAQKEYLGKIIQLPFQLPPIAPDEIRTFLEKLTITLPDNRCRDVFVTGLVVNPREIKRTINIFSLLWSLANKRKELLDKISPVRLAKVVVIQHSYPVLHKILQRTPPLIRDLELFYYQQTKQTDNMVEIPEVLNDFKNDKALEAMFTLHQLELKTDKEIDDECNFGNLTAEKIAVYFTLTSRAQPPIPRSKVDKALDEDMAWAANISESEIHNLSKTELLKYIRVGEYKLENGPISYREDDLIEERIGIARSVLDKLEKTK